MRVFKYVLTGLLVLFGALVLLVIYITPEGPLRTGVRDNWQPPGKPASSAVPLGRENCLNRSATRLAWFGDLHVHTSLSWDAWRYGTTATPADAYRFARGERIDLVPAFDGQERQLQIDRPLDFAAVTDHAEWLADTALCSDADSAVADTWFCRGFRQEGAVNNLRYLYESRLREGRSPLLCGKNGERCRAATLSAWQLVQQAAEDYYDRTSSCQFTTFTGYEHSRRDGFFTMHRNVIFRNEQVPEMPLSWVETDQVEELWEGLSRECNDAPGYCEALAIPHNMNLSSGMAFRLPYQDRGLEKRRSYAALRSRFEPIVEIMQAKGESECRNGLPGIIGGPDEYCDFEKLVPLSGDLKPEYCDPGENDVPFSRCLAPLSYARYGLAEGLSEFETTGVNPLAYGFIGSTDTHSGTPGAVNEKDYQGHTGGRAATAQQRLKPFAIAGASALVNPGGLAGIWAEENARDSLFDAMLRRETFATSGPRIQPRFFAAETLPEDICDRHDMLTVAYESGVPMGGELRGIESPHFLLQAQQDAQSHGLQRMQIIKVWSNGDGVYGQAVHDVEVSDPVQSGLDLNRCTMSAGGASSFCKTWKDPDYNPEKAVAYYMRVIEMPSCRWSRRQCLELPEALRPANCQKPEVPQIVEERAWTSPIWFMPGPASP